jgi:predicted DsbA family dithiol-disulfide isomerase
MRPIVADLVVVSATVFTDPFCPWCWATEPQLRRLEVEFGAEVAFTFVSVGLRARIEDGPDLAYEAIEASAASGMPVDARIFLRDPPTSTHPAGIALHAVGEQAGGARVRPYLRRLHEAILLERRPMDNASALLDAAREVGGIDLERLRSDLGSSAMIERFGADLDRAAATAPEEHDLQTGRVRAPSVEFRGEDGAVHGVYGYASWEAWNAAARAAGAPPSWDGPPDVEAALRRFGSMATPEVALVCDLAPPRAAAELWRLAQDWRVRPRRVTGGELWELV